MSEVENTPVVQEPVADVHNAEQSSEVEERINEETAEMNAEEKNAEESFEKLEEDLSGMNKANCHEKCKAAGQQALVFCCQSGKMILHCAEAGLQKCKSSDKHAFATGMFVGVLAFAMISSLC